MRKQARDHDDHIRTIDAWLKQLIDEVKLLLPEEMDEMEIDSISSSLHFTDQKAFEQHLQTHATNIQSLISRLFSTTQTFTPDVASLHTKVTELLAAEKEHVAELGRLRSETKDLDERLQNASLRYMVAEKKLDRARSVTAAKLEKGLLMGGANSAKSESNSVKREESVVNGVVDHTDELEELEIEVKKVTAISEKQQEQIIKLEEENAQLSTEVTSLTVKTSLLTEDDFAKTELYKQLKSQHDDAVKKLNDLEANNAAAKEENYKLQSERSTYQSQLDSESRNAVAEKENFLMQSEGNLARIRNSRDELLADKAIKQASLDERADSLKKLKELSLAQEERIKALESENERLTSQADDLMATSEVDSLSTEELRSKLNELEKKYALLNGELTSMSSAYQKTQRLASQKVTEYVSLEEKTARLSAEKAKADQKYFATMKLKELRDAEVKTLKMQTTKSSEVVSQLKEAEAASRALLINLEKQVVDLKAALSMKTSEHQSLSKQTANQATDISRLNGQLTDLKTALTSKDAKLTERATACRSAEVEVEGLKVSLTETRRSLESWKNKTGQSEEHELLRQVAYCTVCRKELKDTVIKTCGHTFCHTCVDKVVQLRSRKCPNCGKPFGNNDHQRIIL